MTKNELGQWTWMISLGKNFLPSKYDQHFRYRHRSARRNLCVALGRKIYPRFWLTSRKYLVCGLGVNILAISHLTPSKFS